MKQLSIVTFWLFVCVCASSEVFAQRKAVSGAEVTGTFRLYFTGRFRDSYNEILIQALGGNKLKIEMKMVHPYPVAEHIAVNVGHGTGEAVILGDKAVFTPEDAADGTYRKTIGAKPKFKAHIIAPHRVIDSAAANAHFQSGQRPQMFQRTINRYGNKDLYKWLLQHKKVTQ